MRDGGDNPEATFCVGVVVPTFGHGRTLRGVLDGVAARHPNLPVIAVDDGSSDDTAAVLDAWRDAAGGRHVVSHAVNRGKAAALRSGFAEAEALGCTHAATIDSDGQHDPADLAPLVEAARARPDALVLGERPDRVPGCPRRSLVGRRVSNWLIRLESGLIVRDSQCGLRVYPLASTRRVGGRAGRYGFETAVLTRFGHARLPIVRVPVSCAYDVPGGRVSHFRPLRDSISAAGMHAGLLARSLLPGPRAGGGEATGTVPGRLLRWLNPMPAWRAARADPAARGRFAASAAVGSLVGLLPIVGVKTYVCLAAARLLRLEPVPMLATSSALSAPPHGPLLAVASIAVGGLVLRGEVPDPARYDPRTRPMGEVLADVAVEWTLGGTLLGLGLAAATFLIVRLLLRPGGRQSK